MISFRYHVVSLVAVLLALAVGIAVGSGPLQRSTEGDESGEERALRLAREEVAAAEEELAFADAYTEATANRVVAGRLEGRTVTMVSLPGSEEESVTRVRDLVARSGGEVTARVTLSEELLEVDKRQLVAELASQLAEETAGDVEVPQDADGYERMARLLTHAVATRRRAGNPVDEAGEVVLAGLRTADLAATQGEIDRRGSLVVVVTGEPFGDASTQEGAGSILSTMVTALDAGSRGVVVAGPFTKPEAAADDEQGEAGGLVGAVRADATAAPVVSTVDTVDRAAGAVTAVLAAAAEDAGNSGHYGSSGSPDGAVP